ncbi:MAG: arginine deiminase-related protein [Bacteroidota bacterium]|nr:arginine deiminase-related protein [Bacteroidota bacterium]
MQTTSHILMIRPVNFGFNPETAVNNAFQVKGDDDNTQNKALKEFDDLVSLLRKNDVDVTVVEDTIEPHTPDSIFPNNWVSFHNDGSLLLYPMYAVNRRAERKEHVLEKIKEKFVIRKKIDLSRYEKENIFLEGTGSMVLDRDNEIAYACLSPRTNEKVLADFARQTGYTPVVFHAIDEKGQAIYHTNVMMCVADKYIVICTDSIRNNTEKEKIMTAINKTGKEIITITPDQMNHFAGNMLQVENKRGEKLLVMSTQAYVSLTDMQKSKLQSFNTIIHSPLTTIETNGGGSARCMMAEVHLPVLE